MTTQAERNQIMQLLQATINAINVMPIEDRTYFAPLYADATRHLQDIKRDSTPIRI